MSSWRDLIDLTVAVAVDIPPGTALWDTSKWDDGAKWAASNGWLAIACDDILDLSITSARSSIADNLDTGTASIKVRNAGGWASGQPRPNALAIQPGRAVHIMARAIESGLDAVPIWIGEIDKLSTEWETDGTCIATISAVDAMANLAAVNPFSVGVPQEQAEPRLTRLAGLTGRAGLAIWRPGWARPPVTDTLLQAGTVAQQLVTEATLVANSIGWTIGASPATRRQIIVAPAGLQDTVADPPQMVISNTAGGPTPAIDDAVVCPLTLSSTGPDVTDVANQINLAKAGGTVKRAESTTSQATYGLRTWGRTDLLNKEDPPVVELAGMHLAYRRIPRAIYQLTMAVPQSFPGQYLKGTSVYHWLRKCTHPMAAIAQNASSFAGIPMYLHWNANTSGTGSAWQIDQLALGIGVSHAITRDTWTVTYTADLPGVVEETITVDVNGGAPPAHGTGVWVTATPKAPTAEAMYVNYGDGTPQEVLPDRGGTPHTWSQLHTWAAAGSYTVTCTQGTAYGTAKITVT